MTACDLRRDDQDKVIAGLRWLGMPVAWIQRADVCENGSVYVGLTEVLSKGSVDVPAR